MKQHKPRSAQRQAVLKLFETKEVITKFDVAEVIHRMPEGDEVEIPVAQIAQFHDELRKQYIRVQKLFNVDSEYFLGNGA